MKKVFHLFLCVGVLALHSCNGSIDQSYTNVIPANVNLLVSTNVSDLIEKSGFKDYKSIQAAVDNAQGESLSSTPEILSAILEDPEKSGIDFDAPIYFFEMEDGVSQGIVMKIDNKEKVDTWLQPITQGQGTDSENKIYWDEKGLIIYDKKGSSEWQQPSTPESQFNQSASFKKMCELKGDLHYYISPVSILRKSGIRGAISPTSIYTQTGIVGTCEFGIGHISATAALVANTPEAQNSIDSFKKALRPSEGNFIKYLPGSTIMMISISGKGADYIEYLAATPYLSGVFSPNYRFWEPMAKSIDGDVVVALTGLSNSGVSFVVYAELTPETTETQMRDILARNGMDKAFWGIKDHRLYLTTDKATSENVFKEPDASFKEGEYGKQPKDKPAYFLIDMNSNPLIKQTMSQMGNSSIAQIYNLLSSMEYELNEDYELNMRVNVSEQKGNTLKMITDILTK